MFITIALVVIAALVAAGLVLHFSHNSKLKAIDARLDQFYTEAKTDIEAIAAKVKAKL